MATTLPPPHVAAADDALSPCARAVLTRACLLACLHRKQLRAGGEWAAPKLRTALVAADRNGDGGVLLTEVQDALTACRLALSVPLLESLFRSLRPRSGVVGIADIMSLFQVRGGAHLVYRLWRAAMCAHS